MIMSTLVAFNNLPWTPSYVIHIVESGDCTTRFWGNPAILLSYLNKAYKYMKISRIDKYLWFQKTNNSAERVILSFCEHEIIRQSSHGLTLVMHDCSMEQHKWQHHAVHTTSASSPPRQSARGKAPSKTQKDLMSPVKKFSSIERNVKFFQSYFDSST